MQDRIQSADEQQLQDQQLQDPLKPFSDILDEVIIKPAKKWSDKYEVKPHYTIGGTKNAPLETVNNINNFVDLANQFITFQSKFNWRTIIGFQPPNTNNELSKVEVSSLLIMPRNLHPDLQILFKKTDINERKITIIGQHILDIKENIKEIDKAIKEINELSQKMVIRDYTKEEIKEEIKKEIEKTIGKVNWKQVPEASMDRNHRYSDEINDNGAYKDRTQKDHEILSQFNEKAKKLLNASKIKLEDKKNELKKQMEALEVQQAEFENEKTKIRNDKKAIEDKLQKEEEKNSPAAAASAVTAPTTVTMSTAAPKAAPVVPAEVTAPAPGVTPPSNPLNAGEIIQELKNAFKSDDAQKKESTKTKLSQYLTNIIEKVSNNSLAKEAAEIELEKILTYFYDNDFKKIKEDLKNIEREKRKIKKLPIEITNSSGTDVFRTDIYLVKDLIEKKFEHQLRDQLIEKLQVAYTNDDAKQITSTQNQLKAHLTNLINQLNMETEKNNSAPANELWKILTYLYNSDFIKLKADIKKIENEWDWKFPLIASSEGTYQFQNSPSLYDLRLIRYLVDERFKQLSKDNPLKPISEQEEIKKALQNNIATDDFYILKSKLKSYYINWGNSPLSREKDNLNPLEYTGNKTLDNNKKQFNKQLALRYKVILFDLYLAKTNNNESTAGLRHLLADPDLNILIQQADDKYIPNDSKLKELEVSDPASFHYQKFRDLVAKFKEECNDININKILKDTLEKIDETMRNDKTDASTLEKLEKAVIHAYITIRRKQEYNHQEDMEWRLQYNPQDIDWKEGYYHPDRNAYRKVGNIIEKFIKEKSGLDLIVKYGIDIPHRITQRNYIPPVDLIERKQQAPKKIAFVHTGCLIDNNKINKEKINKEFFNKLKLEYEKVIFWGPKPTDSKVLTELKRFKSIKKFEINDIAKLKKDDDVKNLFDESSYRNLQGDIFQKNKLGEIECSYYLKNDLKNDGRDIQPTPDGVLSFPRTITLTSENEEDKKVFFQNITNALQKYINLRTQEKINSKSSYLTFSIYGRLRGFSAEVKISAAEKLIKHIHNKAKEKLNNKEYKPIITFTPTEIAALQNGILGSIVSGYEKAYQDQDLLPKDINDLPREQNLARSYVVTSESATINK